MTVADYIAQFLVSHGVRHVFGFQGSAMLKMLDAIMATGKIEYVQNFHEQASAFAADAYARISGGIGVAIATSGPGASNLVTGVANAYFDSVPVLFLTGQDRLSHVTVRNGARQNGFQDMDVVGLVKGVTKLAVRVDDAAHLPEVLLRAIETATTGRKGPVLVDIPYDIQFAEVGEPQQPVLSGRECNTGVDIETLKQVRSMFEEAHHPVVLVGGGVRASGAVDILSCFLRVCNWPVVSTLNGLDACRNSVGFAGVYGNSLPNSLLMNADLILALGTRFAYQHMGKKKEEYAPRARIIHVDIDPRELGRTDLDRNGLAVRCDISMFLRAILLASLATRPHANIGDTAVPCRDIVVRFLSRVFAKMPENKIVVADVGSNQMWAAQAFTPSLGLRFITSAGHGAMGYALPAAIGASYQASGPVLCVTGDGGLQMNLQELNTLSLHRQNVKILVLNNEALGLMRKMQQRHFGGRMSGNNASDFSCPDLNKLAECYQIPYVHAAVGDEGVDISGFLRTAGPAMMDVSVPPSLCALTRYEEVCNA